MTNLRQRASVRWTSTSIRLAVATAVGISVYGLTYRLEPDLRILLGYDLAMLTYLGFLVVRMTYADSEATRELAEKNETSNAAVLMLAALLSGCSLAGVGIMLHRSKNWTPLIENIHLGLSLVAVFISWTILHVVFGFHYARLYYDPTPPAGEQVGRTPLEFPDEIQPDFWDFMYFAFTLAVCYQVSDVTIRSRHMRRVALAHMLLSFLNVTMILGLVIEIVSTLAGSDGRRV